jgi:hypothetical protein
MQADLHSKIDAEKRRAEDFVLKDKDALINELLHVTSKRERLSKWGG